MTEPEKLPLTSMDIAKQRREELKALFPSVFTETKNEAGELVESIDFEKLKAELGTFSDLFESRRERYGLDWPGKKDCLRLIQQPSIGSLRPHKESSIEFDTTQNVFAEGDNLEILRLLQKSYFASFKVIYIDPPYNTGNEFIYPDKFSENLDTYLKYAGLVDSEGRQFSSNSSGEGRYHTRWLNMIYPRLYLARNLLREDGVLCVSIDDHEVENLKHVLNDIFGEENHLATIVWQKRYVSNVTAKWLSDMHDFVLVYARNRDAVKINSWERTKEQLQAYRNPDNDPRGDWRAQDLSASKPYSAGMFTITGPTGEKFDPPPNRYWRCNKEQFEKWQADNRIWWGVNQDARPMLKAFLKESERGITPHTWWAHGFAGHNKEATLELKEIFDGDAPFDTPKPVKLMRRVLELFIQDDSLVLDFFAGSAPFAQACLEFDLESSHNVNFVVAQLPEPSSRADYETIADIAKSRIQKVIERLKSVRDEQTLPGIDAASHRSDLGFRSFSLRESCFRVWDTSAVQANPDAIERQLELHIDHISNTASKDDILFELLLKAGFKLSEKVESIEVGSYPVYSISEGALLICLEDEITRELIDAVAEAEPMQFICLDRAFKGNDQLKANAVQTFAARNQGREKAEQIIFRTV